VARQLSAASSQYIDLGAAAFGEMPNTGSFSIWFRPTSLRGLNQIIAWRNTSGGAGEVNVFAGNGQFDFNLMFDFGSTRLNVLPNLGAGAWCHLAATWSAGSAQIEAFKNGASLGTASGYTGLSPGASGFYRLGLDNFGDYSDGCFAEYAVWNAVLTPDEIVGLSKGVPVALARPAALVNYWPLAGRAGAEPDLKTGRTASLVNGPSYFESPPLLRPRAMQAGRGGAYALSADGLGLQLAGQAAAGTVARKLAASAGSVAFAGQAGGLKYGARSRIAAEPGGVASAGHPVLLRTGRKLSAVGGALSLGGRSVALNPGGGLSAGVGAFRLAGQDAGLAYVRSIRLAADPGPRTLASQGATLRFSAADGWSRIGRTPSPWAPAGAAPAAWTPSPATPETWTRIA
jgi:hypothetical protein